MELGFTLGQNHTFGVLAGQGGRGCRRDARRATESDGVTEEPDISSPTRISARHCSDTLAELDRISRDTSLGVMRVHLKMS